MPEQETKTETPAVAKTSAAEDAVSDAISERPAKQEFGAPEPKAKEEAEETTDAEPEAKPATDKKIAETVKEAEAEGETSESKEEAATPETDAEKEVKKTGEQKRIDKLTAVKKSLEEENAKLKVELEKAKPKDAKPKYTREQLIHALNQYIKDGDAEGIYEVQEYLAEMKKQELKDEYVAEQNKRQEAIKKNQTEWRAIEMHYSDDEDPSLDIRKTNSELYQVAKQFFEDPEIGKIYSMPGGGGMIQAVADALTEILKKRLKKGETTKTDVLSKRLAKEKRKTSLGEGGAAKEETTVPSSGNDYDDYIAERKATLAKARGMSI